jgi:hypothetical protein
MNRDSNLPPGCRESDLPGCSPADVAWERWLDSALNELASLVNDSEDHEEQFVAMLEEHYEPWDDDGGPMPPESAARLVADLWRERRVGA